MKYYKMAFWLLIASWLMAGSAMATPIRYELSGILQQSTSADPYDFQGADFLATYEFDTAAQTPSQILSGAGLVNAEYTPSLAEVQITSRPNSQPDATSTVYNVGSDPFRVINFFSPRSDNDG